MLSILHVSDFHMGVTDPNNEQPLMTTAIIRALEVEQLKPDVVVISGDLANRGAPEEFEIARRWLLSLFQKVPQVPVYIVPGNHDCDRNVADVANLRKAGESHRKYNTWRENNRDRELGHLLNFYKWHSETADELRLGFDWNVSQFAAIDAQKINGITIKFVGLNTALLSCDDRDEGRLVADIPRLNQALADVETSDLVIAIGHHPAVDWPSLWNSDMLLAKLKQQTGPHFYLHGHLHEQAGSANEDMGGPRHSTLAAGSAYQGSKYPNGFSVYDIDCKNNQIKPKIFVFDIKRGLWRISNEKSSPISITLPNIKKFEVASNRLNANRSNHSHLRAQMERRRREKIMQSENDLRMYEIVMEILAGYDNLHSRQDKDFIFELLQEEKLNAIKNIRQVLPQSSTQYADSVLFGNDQAILIHDDRQDRIDDMRELLNNNNFTQVGGLTSLSLVLKRLRNYPIDLIMLDLSLPHPDDGIRALHEVFEITKQLPTRIITYTNQNFDEKLLTTTRNMGASDCIYLPLEELILHRVDDCLRDARAHRQFLAVAKRIRDLFTAKNGRHA